jgi:hypothetical protein
MFSPLLSSHLRKIWPSLQGSRTGSQLSRVLRAPPRNRARGERGVERERVIKGRKEREKEAESVREGERD